MLKHSNLPGQAAEYEEEINPATWRKIELLLIHPDGSYSQIILLRPLTWLSQITPDGRVWLNLPEMSCVGWASVRSIQPCPPLEEGAGRVITGTFRHSDGQVLDVSIQTPHGKITLGATAAHPFWSDDRHDFVPAANLRQGERLRTLFGLAQVVSIIPRGPPEPVYNLEVRTDHTYLVDQVGVLVHNASPCTPSRAVDPKTVVNALSKFRSKIFTIKGHTLLLDKKGLKHMLQRHHPRYWDGSIKETQSFFSKKMSIKDLEIAIGEVLRQNRDRVGEIGTRGMGAMTGVVNGQKFQLGLNKGRVGQFYPIYD